MQESLCWRGADNVLKFLTSFADRQRCTCTSHGSTMEYLSWRDRQHCAFRRLRGPKALHLSWTVSVKECKLWWTWKYTCSSTCNDGLLFPRGGQILQRRCPIMRNVLMYVCLFLLSFSQPFIECLWCGLGLWVYKQWWHWDTYPCKAFSMYTCEIHF